MKSQILNLRPELRSMDPKSQINFNYRNSKRFWSLFGIGCLGFGIFAVTLAQTPPELIVTWRAFTYAPPDYAGKILPTRKTLLTAAVEALQKDKLMDLSQKEIRWYLDSRLIGAGRGLKNVSFRLPATVSQNPRLRVTIDNQDKFVNLPLAEPEVMITDSQTPGGRPYFFNINRLDELDWQWQKNEQFLRVFVQNRVDPLEFAKNQYALP